MVLIFSRHSNGSNNVRREVERAVNKGLTLIPFRIENVEPSDAFELFLSLPQWIDAYAGPFDRHLDRLCDAVRSALDARGDAASPPSISSSDQRIFAPFSAPQTNENWAENTGPLWQSKTALGLGAVAVLSLVIGLSILHGHPDNFSWDGENHQQGPRANSAQSDTVPPGDAPTNDSRSGCYGSTEDCTVNEGPSSLSGPLTFDLGLKVGGRSIQIEGAPDYVSTLRLQHLVEKIGPNKIVRCEKKLSGKYRCFTTEKENLADILAKIGTSKH
jgi:hypothetical protein